MIRSFRLFSALAFLAGISCNSWAATPLEMTGGTSGFVQTISCQEGEAVVGATVLLQDRDSIFAGVFPLCDTVRSGGGLHGKPHAAMGVSATFFRGLGTLDMREESDQKEFFHQVRKMRSVTCPAGTRVNGYQAIAGDDEGGIGLIRLDCAGSGVTTIVTLAADSVPAAPRKGGHFQCASTENATGFMGRSGSWLQAFGLVCGAPDMAQLAIQNENNKLFDKMEEKTVSYKKDDQVTGTYHGFRYTDGVVVYDYANGKASGFWPIEFRAEWGGSPIDPQDPAHLYSGGVPLHGIADADGKIIGKPNYSQPLVLHSPQIASVKKRNGKGPLFSLETGEEKPFPHVNKYKIEINKRSVAFVSDGLVTDADGTAITFLNPDGSPGKTLEHIVGFRGFGLYGQFAQKASDGQTKTLWVNVDQTVNGTTLPVKRLYTYRGAPQDGFPLGPSPAGWGKVMENTLYRMASISGFPHSQPEDIVGVTPFTQKAINNFGWVFVSQTSAGLRYRVSFKGGFDEAVKEYANLFPFLELVEAQAKEKMVGGAIITQLENYDSTMIVGRMGPDDWIPVSYNLTGEINTLDKVAAAYANRHAQTPQTALDAPLVALNASQVKSAGALVEDWLKKSPYTSPGLGKEILKYALSTGGDLPGRVATSQWMIDINRMPGAIDKLCAQPSVKNCAQLRSNAQMQLAAERQKECAWNARLCMNAAQIAAADAQLEAARQRGTPAQQWERAVAAAERESTARINAMGEGMMRTQDRNNAENCAAAAKGANRNCSVSK